jgi:hypothetical protein
VRKQQPSGAQVVRNRSAQRRCGFHRKREEDIWASRVGSAFPRRCVRQRNAQLAQYTENYSFDSNDQVSSVNRG